MSDENKENRISMDDNTENIPPEAAKGKQDAQGECPPALTPAFCGPRWLRRGPKYLMLTNDIATQQVILDPGIPNLRKWGPMSEARSRIPCRP
jgi:hypothetical protein